MPDPTVPSLFNDPTIGFNDPAMGFNGTPGNPAIPVVTSVSPTSGPDGGGTPVTITGLNLGGVTGPDRSFDIGIATGAGIPTQADIDRYAASGAQVIRCSAVNWTSNNGGGTSGSFVASATRDSIDAFVKACNLAGLKVILGVNGGNNSSGNGGAGMNTYSTNFAAFCIAVASRYQHGSANGEIECLEVGNEPNRSLWDSTFDPGEYAHLMSLIYPGVVALGANRPLVMIGGIAGDPSSGASGMSCAEWTSGLYGGPSFPLGFSPGFGIPSHNEFTAYKAAGASHVRLDIRWDDVDTGLNGTLDNTTALDNAITYCDSIGLDVWLLASGSGAVDMNLSTVIPNYAKYLANLAAHLDGVTRVIGIECGNEVDAGPWGHPQAPYGAFKGQSYAEIMIRLYDPAFEDVKSRSDRPIFTGSTARADPLTHYKEAHGRGGNSDPVVYVTPAVGPPVAFPDGMRGHYDGICIHPYDEKKFASQSLAVSNGGTYELTRVMDFLLTEFGDVPDLAITEYGYTTYDPAGSDTPAKLAAEAAAIPDLVTTYNNLVTTNGWTIAAFCWFEFMDKTRVGADDKSFHWGIVTDTATFPIPDSAKKPAYDVFHTAATSTSSTSIKGNYDVWNTHRYTFPYTPQENITAGRLRGWLAATTGDGVAGSATGSEQIRLAFGDGSTGPGANKPHACTEFGIPEPFPAGSGPAIDTARWIASFSGPGGATTLYDQETGACYFCYFTDYDKKNQATATTLEKADASNWHGLWLDTLTPKPVVYDEYKRFASASVPSDTTVIVGELNATIVTNTDIQIEIVTPPHAPGTVDILVDTNAGTSLPTAADQFTYTSISNPAAPSILLIQPSGGPSSGGTTVTITGTQFAFATRVDFGGLPAQFTIDSDTQITAIAPAHPPGPVDVTVTNSSGTSGITAADVFTYFPPRPPITRNWTIHVRDAGYIRRGQVEDFTSLVFTSRHNAVGQFILTVPATSAVRAQLDADQAGIIVSADGQVVFSGPIRDRVRAKHDKDDTLTVSGPDDMFWLAARHANREPSTPAPPYDHQLYDVRVGVASTVISQYVDVNVGVSSLARRRIPALSIDVDMAIGSTVLGLAGGQTLLALIQQLALASIPEIGFRLRQDGTALIFSTYLPRDLSHKAIFQDSTGTLGDFEYEQAASNANYIYAAGKGSGIGRLIVEGENGIDINRWGMVEEVLARADLGTEADLLQAITFELRAQTGTFRLDLSIVDTAGSTWQVDYQLGDQVGVIIDGVHLTELVREIQVELGPNGDTEKITPSVSSPTPKTTVREQALFSLVRSLAARVADIERNQ